MAEESVRNFVTQNNAELVVCAGHFKHSGEDKDAAVLRKNNIEMIMKGVKFITENIITGRTKALKLGSSSTVTVQFLV